MTARTAWQDKAACRDHENPDLWFAEDEASQERAKAICDTCPVTLHCLIHQSRFTGLDGIWGGKTGKALKSARRQLREMA